jgi:excisionase family DNA binding protein
MDLGREKARNACNAREPAARGDRVAPRRYLTRTEVARLLDVSPATVARWTRQGKLRFVLTLGGQRRYARREILEVARGIHEPRRAAGPVPVERAATAADGVSRPAPPRVATGTGRRRAGSRDATA